MGICKVGEVFQGKFGGKPEPKFEVMFGSLPVQYSVLKAFRHLEEDSRYKLALLMSVKEGEEAFQAILERLVELNKEGRYGATKKQLEECLEQAFAPAEKNEGMYRFYGSKKMAFLSKETHELAAIDMKVYDGDLNEESLMEGGAMLGAGSKVRSSFLVSLWSKGKKVYLNINPQVVVVVEKKEVPKKDTYQPDFGSVEDSQSSYDF